MQNSNTRCKESFCNKIGSVKFIKWNPTVGYHSSPVRQKYPFLDLSQFTFPYSPYNPSPEQFHLFSPQSQTSEIKSHSIISRWARLRWKTCRYRRYSNKQGRSTQPPQSLVLTRYTVSFLLLFFNDVFVFVNLSLGFWLDQELVKKGCEALNKCEDMINKLGLFSANETKEDISTTDLKYILVIVLLLIVINFQINFVVTLLLVKI